MTAQPYEFPTAEEFLAMPGTPEDDEEEAVSVPRNNLPSYGLDTMWVIPDAHPLLRPLQDIAERLEWIARGPAEAESAADRLNQEYDDLEAKHQALFGLLADIEKLVKPSTSKLAGSVRQAITDWKTGAVAEPEPTPEDPNGGDLYHPNHSWARTEEGPLACACGAWIDESDPDQPNGIVREPGYESDPNA